MSVYFANTSYSANAMVPAYRPVLINAISDSTSDSVYCDVYFNGVYYKTLTCFAPLFAGSSLYQLDIQDAAQEYLQSLPPSVSSGLQAGQGNVVSCYCKLRGSSVVSGFVTPDGTAPVQATWSSSAVPGTGYQTETIYIVNATLQHKDNQVLLTHLGNNWPIISGSTIPPWNYSFGLFLLTHNTSNIYARNNPVTGVNESGYFPVLITPGGFAGGSSSSCQLALVGSDNVTYNLGDPMTLNDGSVCYVPYGYKQLSGLTGFSAIPKTLTSYKMALIATVFNPVAGHPIQLGAFLSPQVTFAAPYANGSRITFLNSLGAYDSLSFNLYDEILVNSSSLKEKPLVGLPTSGNKTITGQSRYNVRSNINGQLSAAFPDSAMEWLKELYDSPSVFVEWNGADSQSADYIPIIIQDVSQQITKSSLSKYSYDVVIKFQASNNYIRHRN